MKMKFYLNTFLGLFLSGILFSAHPAMCKLPVLFVEQTSDFSPKLQISMEKQLWKMYPTDLSLTPHFEKLVLTPTMANELKYMRLHFSNFPPHQINEASSLDWEKSPVQSLTWSMKFYSLYWLHLLDKKIALKYIETWLYFYEKAITVDTDYSKTVFFDHTVAMRLETFIHLFPNVISFEDKQIVERYKKAMLMDAFLLEAYLCSNKFDLSNHTLFQAQSLLLFADTFRDLPQSKKWKKLAIEKLKQLPYKLFDKTGLTVEQSATYQLNNLIFCLYAYQLLEKQSVATQELDEMMSYLEKAAVATLYLLRPDKSFVMMGDTNNYQYEQSVLKTIKTYFSKTSNPILKKIILENEISLQTRLFAYENAIMVFYPQNAEKRYLMIDFSSQRQSHGHFDAMNWHFSTLAGNWIVDAGGPYEYTSEAHKKLLSSRMHNVPLLKRHDGLNAEKRVIQGPGHSSVISFQEKADFWDLILESNVYGGKGVYRRRFIVLKDMSAFAVLDFKASDIISIVSPVLLDVDVSVHSLAKGCFELRHKNETWLLMFYSDKNSYPFFALKEVEISPSFRKFSRTTQILSFIKPKSESWSGWTLGKDKKAIFQLKAILLQI